MGHRKTEICCPIKSLLLVGEGRLNPTQQCSGVCSWQLRGSCVVPGIQTRVGGMPGKHLNLYHTSSPTPSCPLFVLFVLGHTRGYSWLKTQELVLIVLGRPYGLLEIELRLAACKTKSLRGFRCFWPLGAYSGPTSCSFSKRLFNQTLSLTPSLCLLPQLLP